MTFAILVHIDSEPASWTEAAKEVVFSLTGDVRECTPTSWEVTDSPLDAAAVRMELSKSVGNYARVTCIEITEGKPVVIEGAFATLMPTG